MNQGWVERGFKPKMGLLLLGYFLEQLIICKVFDIMIINKQR